ncbi:MAG: ubiquinol-cytochrome c reductase iron-sulfur subunit [Chloroflexi bacterium]|nr:ubiquinol-cytochrome c reductase iron-sulfur subunit [Chloroflexota bacterium]MBI5704466.1 ubiquinol-cytochrome c reductase iron-sulfur subunit [Chloroflexota bacterium]GER78822.1 ubiquinol-cytochrome c reductase iron-sulfur subunit [Candidatus Denitrolinea symbiosum]
MSASGRNQLSRRDFIKATVISIGGLIGAVIGMPSVAYLLSPSLRAEEDSASIDLGPLEKYPIGVPTRFEFTRTKVNGWERTTTNYGMYVVRRSESEVRVFSDICTHLGCRVTWHPDQEHYVSPCHDGHFDIEGSVISGPPPRPLDEFVTEIEDGNLLIHLPALKRTS